MGYNKPPRIVLSPQRTPCEYCGSREGESEYHEGDCAKCGAPLPEKSNDDFLLDAQKAMANIRSGRGQFLKKFKLCKVHKSIRLNPDFACSGIECADCGIVFGDPKENFPLLPEGLIALIQVWNDHWDFASENENRGIKYKELTEKLILDAGLELITLVNQYYPCKIENTNNWKLFQYWKEVKHG